MKIGLYSNWLSRPSPGNLETVNLPRIIEMADAGFDHYASVDPSYSIDPETQHGLVNFFQAMQDHGLTCGVGLYSKMPDGTNWREAYLQGRLDEYFAAYAFCNDLPIHDFYAGHEVWEFMSRADRKVWNDTWKAVCPNVPMRMYVAGFAVPIRRADQMHPLDKFHPDTPLPWSDYIVGDSYEPPILSWACDWASDPVGIRDKYRRGSGYLNNLAHSAWTLIPMKYVHVNVDANDSAEQVIEALNILDEEGADVALLRTQENGAPTEAWPFVFDAVSAFTSGSPKPILQTVTLDFSDGTQKVYDASETT